tara:strand:+ start:906 stop:1508 length:603 start_codon:yes stop_codon:yes gene_type:complete
MDNILPNVSFDDENSQNMNDFVDEILDEEPMEEVPESSDDEVLDIQPKEIIPTETIFNKPKVHPVKKEKKPRKPMTEDHKEKLKIARVKALETRRKNAELRKQGQMKKPSEIKEDKIKEQKELERPIINKTINNTTNITKDDIEEITSKAIQNYDIQRKERKAKKKEDNALAIEQQKVHQIINNATGYKYGQDGYFKGCF